jgi:hypothetical protein
MLELSPEDLQQQAARNREAALHRVNDAGVDLHVMMHVLAATQQNIKDWTGQGVLIREAQGRWRYMFETRGIL